MDRATRARKKRTRGEARAAGNSEAERGESDAPRTGRDALVGRWSRDADCGRILEFRDDGTLVSATNEEGRWSTEAGSGANQLMLTMEDDTQRARVGVEIRGDELRMTNVETDNATIDMQRCAAD